MTTTQNPAWATTTGGRRVKEGQTLDPEDGRTTHRLRLAQSILRDLGVEPTLTHSAQCIERKLVPPGFGWYNGCDYKCETTWPEWATGRMFDLAYQMADEIQTERGKFNRRDVRAADLCPRCGGDHDRIDRREACPS
jgi:hypothetical protein